MSVTYALARLGGYKYKKNEQSWFTENLYTYRKRYY